MNFSKEIKQEIFSKRLPHECCKKAYLAGFIRATGSIIKNSDGYGFEFSSENDGAIEYFTYLFKEVYGYEINLATKEKDKLNKQDRKTYEFAGEKALYVLDDLDIFKKAGKSYEVNISLESALLGEECCKKAFIKGIFVGSGVCTLPNRSDGKEKSYTGYHLEFIFSNYSASEEFSRFLAEIGIFPKIASRKNNYIVYVKSSEEIKDFLAYVGLSKCVIKITNLIVEKEVFNNINRQTNCDIGNIGRQQTATEKQIKAIKTIDEVIGLNSLPSALSDVAVMRLAHSEDSLTELADKMGITKSCLNHRLRKITEIASNLSE